MRPGKDKTPCKSAARLSFLMRFRITFFHRRARVVYAGLLSLTFLTLFYFVITVNHSGNTDPIYIYTATTYFGQNFSEYDFPDRCPELKRPCIRTDNPQKYSKVSAVIFHSVDFKWTSDLPGPRNLNIPFIFYSLESPSNDAMRMPYAFLNWTMHYKRNSDVWNPYGRLVRLRSVVDIFGKCGQSVPKQCDGLENRYSDCMKTVTSVYKFYIAFENSNCPDYVTEKFFETLQRGLIPIVVKRQYYEDLGIPSDIFIAVDDFKTPEELVRYVKRIAADEQAYNRYFEWRNRYRVVTHLEPDPETGWCALCQKLQKGPPYPKTEDKPDIRQWATTPRTFQNTKPPYSQMPVQEFDTIDYLGALVVGVIFSICCFLFTIFVNFFWITKYDNITVFERLGSKYNMRLGPHRVKEVQRTIYLEETEDCDRLSLKVDEDS
ncbi:unnamed protein product, partial [Mesorhabditis spiculigera]